MDAMSPFLKEMTFEVANGKVVQSLIHPQDVNNLCILSLMSCRDDIHQFRQLVSDSVRGILKYTLKEEDNPEKNWKHIARCVYESIWSLNLLD